MSSGTDQSTDQGTDQGTDQNTDLAGTMERLRAAIAQLQVEVTQQGIELTKAAADAARANSYATQTNFQMAYMKAQIAQVQAQVALIRSRIGAFTAGAVAESESPSGIGPGEAPGSSVVGFGDDGGDVLAPPWRGPAVVARDCDSLEWHAYERYEDAKSLLTDGHRCQQAIFICSWVWHPAGDIGPNPA